MALNKILTAASNLNQPMSAPEWDAANTVKVAIGATSVQSGAIEKRYLLVTATAACHIDIGANPTATTDLMYLPANVPFVMSFTAGDRIAVIQATGAGNLHITPAKEN